MATIVNPNPIQPQTFDSMWIQSVGIIMPVENARKGSLVARLLPYDGTNLLALGEKNVNIVDIQAKRNTDPQFDACIAAIITECKRLANTTANIVRLSITANDPSKPVVAFVVFDNKTSYSIRDCFDLAGKDPIFAQVFSAVLGEIAQLAGLQVEV